MPTFWIRLFRRIYDPSAKQGSNVLARRFSFNIEDGFVVEDSIFVLQPYDEVQVRKSPVYAEQQNVRVSGCVNFEGQFAMTHRTFRLSDLIQMAGGTTAEAYIKGARLIRKMNDEERLQRDKSNLNNQILLMERGLEKESFNYALADSILMLKTNSDDTYSVAINLDQAMAEPGGSSDIMLRAGDRLIVPEYSGVVKISGGASRRFS